MDLQELKRVRDQMKDGVVIHKALVIEILEFAIEEIEELKCDLKENFAEEK